MNLLLNIGIKKCITEKYLIACVQERSFLLRNK